MASPDLPTDSNARKRCTKCGTEKDCDEFGKHVRRKDGLSTQCKACRCVGAKLDRLANSARIKDYLDANRDKIAERKAQWYQENRERELARSRAYNLSNPETRKRWREQNSDKVREYSRDHAKRNPGARAEIHRRYAKAHPERMREKCRARYHKAGAKIPRAEYSAWLTSQAKVCHWCGVDVAEGFHVDHYHPLARGGKHETANLVISCVSCNCRKGAKDPLEFIKELRRHAKSATNRDP